MSLKGSVSWLIARRAVRAVVFVVVTGLIAAGLVQPEWVTDVAGWLAEAAVAPVETSSGS